jgi:ketosteroid isomerase-like protein
VSQENVEIVQRLYDYAPEAQTLLNSGKDIRSHPWLLLWHPECVVEEMDEAPDASAYHGRDGIVRYFERIFNEVWTEWRFVPQEFIDGPEGVFVAVANSGLSRTGIEVNMQIFHTFRLRDRMIVHAKGRIDRGAALSAVGLEG